MELFDCSYWIGILGLKSYHVGAIGLEVLDLNGGIDVVGWEPLDGRSCSGIVGLDII